MENTDTLYIENLGPIQSAQVEFGDLTIFVGPQASGKTICAELFKLVKDKDFILHSIEDTYKLSVAETLEDTTLDKYFGNGMHSIWNNQTVVSFNEKPFDTSEFYSYNEELSNSFSVYYIPAKRLSEFDEGRLKDAYEVRESPYIMREFRDLIDGYLWALQLKADNSLFYFDNFNDKIFGQGKIGMQKKDRSDPWRLVQNYNGSIIDYAAWSTGQGEYTPLRIALQDIMVNPIYKYIIIEEPETGLHPQAIVDFMVEVVKLMKKFKVILITHSTEPLNFVWALKNAEQYKAEDVAKLLNSQEVDAFDNINKKILKVYAFVQDNDKRQTVVKDISNLDAWADNSIEANFGGLTDFSNAASNFVSDFYNEEDDYEDER